MRPVADDWQSKKLWDHGCEHDDDGPPPVHPFETVRILAFVGVCGVLFVEDQRLESFDLALGVVRRPVQTLLRFEGRLEPSSTDEVDWAFGHQESNEER